MPAEPLTIKEVVAILKMVDRTIYRMANDREIPMYKIRGQWRIRRSELDAWLDEQAKNRVRTGVGDK